VRLFSRTLIDKANEDICFKMNEISVQYYKSPYGELVLGAFGEKLCLCNWRYRKNRASIDGRLAKCLAAAFIEGDNAVLKRAISQLDEYFNYKRKLFDIPLLMVGTDFQKRVWTELAKVPFGKTSSYLQLAERVGNKKAVRAVASANGANAISIIIPCHRIIGSNGQLAGYAGGLTTKKKLLELEQDLFAQ
jgi:methylated-DNA-[protein]-cysteine S-methyltransferase